MTVRRSTPLPVRVLLIAAAFTVAAFVATPVGTADTPGLESPPATSGEARTVGDTGEVADPVAVDAAVVDAPPAPALPVEEPPMSPEVVEPSTATTAAPAVEATPTTVPAVAEPASEPPGPLDAARAALDEVVPPGWFGSSELQWSLITGSTSLSSASPPLIEVGDAHLANHAKLRFVMAHEWGHHVAFRYGDAAAGFGYGPTGFPSSTSHPAEEWAGCVAEVLVTDFWMPSHGLPHCNPEALTFTAAFLAAGPPR